MSHQYVELRLPGKVKSKKNGKKLIKRRGKILIASSDAYMAWAQHARFELLKQKSQREGQGDKFPLTGKLRLIVSFYMVGKQHEPDLSNLLEGPQDLLQEMGIIQNDKQITEIVAKKRMGAPVDWVHMVITTEHEEL